jgi:hypothetical protein
MARYYKVTRLFWQHDFFWYSLYFGSINRGKKSKVGEITCIC